MSDTDAPNPLALADSARRVLGDWTLSEVAGVLPGGVSVRLTRARDGATIQLVIVPPGRQALAETRFGGVYYKRHTGLTEREAGDTARAFARLLDEGGFPLAAHFPHLALSPNPGAAERRRLLQLAPAQLRALPGGERLDTDDPLPETRGELYFDPPGIAAFLAPELVVDGPALAGHTLRAIYLPAVGKRQELDLRHYVLEFLRPDTAESVRLRLGADSHDEGFGRSGPLSLSLLGYTQDLDAVPPQVASLCSWVLALLQLKLTPATALRVPDRAEAVRALSHPPDRANASAANTTNTSAASTDAATTSAPTSLNLAIDTECGQRCAFCSVKAYVRPLDEGERALENIRVQLRAARDQGVREVRVNGIDPLTFSRILEVLDAVREGGFARTWVYSTCRRLADAQFRGEFLRRAPINTTVTVPLYGVTAAAHDAVTNTPGSYAEARAAFDALHAEAGPARLAISTVVVRQNLHELPQLAALARDRGVPFHPHLPYPMRQTTRDPYAESALRERDIVEHFVAHLDERARLSPRDALSSLGNLIPHPCLLWRAEQKHRLPVFGARAVDAQQPLAGTEYRSAQIVHGTGEGDVQGDAFAVATTPCPHAGRCALATVCPAEHYQVYASLYGLDEFAPVRVAELYEAAPARGVGLTPATRRA